MYNHVQLAWLQGLAIGFVYYDSLMEEDYDLEDYPIEYVERYQFMFLFFAFIWTRWYEES